MMPPPGMSKKINALSVIGVIVIGVIVFEKKWESLREKLVTLKGCKNLLHSYEKLSPQLGSIIFLTGAKKLSLLFFYLFSLLTELFTVMGVFS
jgi:hypothetical protein